MFIDCDWAEKQASPVMKAVLLQAILAALLDYLA